MADNGEMPNFEPCGAQHPNDPSITCVNHGPCQFDWHRGIVGPTGRRRFIEWGKDYESAQTYEREHYYLRPHWLPTPPDMAADIPAPCAPGLTQD